MFYTQITLWQAVSKYLACHQSPSLQPCSILSSTTCCSYQDKWTSGRTYKQSSVFNQEFKPLKFLMVMTVVWTSCCHIDSRVDFLLSHWQSCGRTVVTWTVVWTSCCHIDSRVDVLLSHWQSCGRPVVTWTVVWTSCCYISQSEYKRVFFNLFSTAWTVCCVFMSVVLFNRYPTHVRIEKDRIE
jgi:hypothetical protein